jgi:hypothetical protein
LTVWGNFSQGAGTSGTERHCVFTAGSGRVKKSKGEGGGGEWTSLFAKTSPLFINIAESRMMFRRVCCRKKICPIIILSDVVLCSSMYKKSKSFVKQEGCKTRVDVTLYM